MAVIDKTHFVGKYGIDDDNFITFINNNCYTFKQLLAIKKTTYYISKEDLTHIYNRYVYYRSIGMKDYIIYLQVKNEIKEVVNNINYFGIVSSNNFINTSTTAAKCIIKNGVAYVVINIDIKTATTGSETILGIENLPAPIEIQALDVNFKNSETNNYRFVINNAAELRIPPNVPVGKYCVTAAYPIQY